jgi:hypothetical protein
MPSIREKGVNLVPDVRDVFGDRSKAASARYEIEACNAAGSTSDSKPSASRPPSRALLKKRPRISNANYPIGQAIADNRDAANHLRARGFAPVSHIAAGATGQSDAFDHAKRPPTGAWNSTTNCNPLIRPPEVDQTFSKPHAQPQTGDAHNGGGITPTCRFL